MATAEVVIVKYGETVAPALTVTEGGTTALGELLVRVTVTPAAGAGALIVTLFNVAETPPTTLAGDMVTETSAIGVTVRFADFSPL